MKFSKIIFLTAFSISMSIVTIAQENCVSANDQTLFKKINDHRKSFGLNELDFSPELSKLCREKAQLLIDGNRKDPNAENDLFHNNQKCAYMSFRGMDANGTNSFNSFVKEHPALPNWKVILEKEDHTDADWKSIGVSCYKNYSVLWFSDKSCNDCELIVCEGSKESNETAIIIKREKKYPEWSAAKWLCYPKFARVSRIFNQGDLIPVNDWNKWGFVNKKGEYVIEPQFSWTIPFNDGLAGAKNDESLYGYINTKGEYMISPQYNSASSFRNDRMVVSLNNENFVIDQSGNKLIGPYSDISGFGDNYYAVLGNGGYSIVDREGEIVKKSFMQDFWGFNEGLAAAKSKGKWGFIDESFEWVIPPTYSEKIVYMFHDGVSRIKKNGKIGCINKEGEEIIAPNYNELYEFSEGLAAATKGNKWGYINLKEEWVIKEQFDFAYNFNEGFAIVKMGLKKALIDKTGKIVVDEVDDIVHVFGRLYAVKVHGEFGFIEMI